jgi:hypothetical protein
MDSTKILLCGKQEQSVYYRQLESTCYHPLLLFNRDGDWPGQQVARWRRAQHGRLEALLLPEFERQQAMGKEVAFRADAELAKPEFYDALEQRDEK